MSYTETYQLSKMDICQVLVNDTVELDDNKYGIWFSTLTCSHFPELRYGTIDLGHMFRFVGGGKSHTGSIYKYVHHLKRPPTAQEIFEAAGYGLTQAGFSWRTHEVIHTTDGGKGTYYFIITGYGNI